MHTTLKKLHILGQTQLNININVSHHRRCSQTLKSEKVTYTLAQSSAKSAWICKYELGVRKRRSVLWSRAEVRSLPARCLSFTPTQIMSELPIRGDSDSAPLRERHIAQPEPPPPVALLWPHFCIYHLSHLPSRSLKATLGNPEHRGFQPGSDHEKAKRQRLRMMPWCRSDVSAALSVRLTKTKNKNQKRTAHLCTVLAAAQPCL